MTKPLKVDTDKDGLTDGEEVNVYGTNPLSNVDTDSDGMPSDWEQVRGTDPMIDDALVDADGDGVDNVVEYLRSTLPLDASSVPIISTVYVDAANLSGIEDGTTGNPFTSIVAAINAAQAGDVILLAPGKYNKDSYIYIGKAVKIVGPADLSADITANNINLSAVPWGGFSYVTMRVNYSNLFSTRNFVFEANHLFLRGYLWLAIGSRITFNHNLIESTGTATEAFWIDNNSHMDLVNNTIVGFPVGVRSEAYYFSTLGGTPGTAMIRNTTLVNTSDIVAPTGTIDIQYSLIGDGQFAGTNGNLTGDPLFVDAVNGDYHLQAVSPAMDSGDPTDPYDNEPQPSGCRINIGAYGNTVEATISTQDPDGDGLLGYCGSPTISGLWSSGTGVNTPIFVFGSNFKPNPNTQITVNGINAPLVQIMSPEVLIFLLPAGNTIGPVQITTPAGTATSPVNFGSGTGGLSVDGLWPSIASAGDLVFVFGFAFEPASTTVSLNSQLIMTTQIVNDQLAIFLVPTGATSGPVTVTTSAGTVTGPVDLIIAP